MGAGENEAGGIVRRWGSWQIFYVSTYVARARRPLSSTYGTSYLPTMEGTRTRCQVVLHIKMLLMIVFFQSLEGGVRPEGCKEAKRIQVLSIYLYFKRWCGISFLIIIYT